MTANLVPTAVGAVIAVAAPMCGCEQDTVSRFVDLDGAPHLVCKRCFAELGSAGLVKHHTRTSHGDCNHDKTPAERAKCRAARLRGDIYDPEADELVSTVVGGRKGSKVHAADDDGAPMCSGKVPAKATVADAPADTIDCACCSAILADDEAA